LRQLDERIQHQQSEVDRAGWDSPLLKRLSRSPATISTAGRLAPLDFGDEELRRLQAAVLRGEASRIETRAVSSADSLLPADLYPQPIMAVHESRILDKLPGYATDLPRITFIRHTSTTGVPAPTLEGALKPELVLNTDEVTADLCKIAAHTGLSWEIL